MSKAGVKKVADIFSILQQTRIDLLGGDSRDMMLGQVLATGKDAMQPEFIRIASEEADHE